jgi:hypothetical protein
LKYAEMGLSCFCRSDADLQEYVNRYSLPVQVDKPREGIIATIRQSYHGAVDVWSDSDLKGAKCLYSIFESNTQLI